MNNDIRMPKREIKTDGFKGRNSFCGKLSSIFPPSMKLTDVIKLVAFDFPNGFL